MKKLLLLGFLCMLTGTISLSANELKVLKSKPLPNGSEMQVVKDAQGRIFKRMTKDSTTAAPVPQSVATKSETAVRTFYEGFEGYEISFGLNWIPDGWTKQNTAANTPTEEQLSHNVNNSWYVYLTSDMFQEPTTDGTKEAFIHYSYDGQWCEESEQDEWLITPEIQLAANETLHFMLQADFFNVYNCDDFDWSNISYPERIMVNTLSVMVTDDGGENWTQAWDLVADVADKMTDRECYDASDLAIRHFDVDLSAYSNKKVKIAFRYIREQGGWNGNSMILDGIVIDHEPNGVVETVISEADMPATLYNLNGMRIDTDNVAPGIYIKKQGSKIEKVIAR